MSDAYPIANIPAAACSEAPARTPLVTATTFWSVSAAAVVTLFAIAQAQLSIIASFVLFGGLGLLWARCIDAIATRLFAVVYGAGAVAAVALFINFQSLYGVPYMLGGSDEVHYEEMGKAFAESLGVFDYIPIRGTLVSAWHNSVAYIYLVGLQYKFAQLFGVEHTMVPRLFNAACLALVAVGIYRLGRKLALRRETAIVAALFAGCLPLMMWVAAQTLRDVVVTALLVGMVIVWTPDITKTRQESLVRAILWTLAITIALVDLRRGQAFVAAIVAGIGLLAGSDSRRLFVWLICTGAVLGGAAGVYMTLSDFIDADLARLLIQADQYTEYRADAMGGGLSTVVFTTPPPLGYLLRIGYALVTPLPVLTTDLHILWLDIGTITHVFFIPFLFAGLGIAWRRREWWVVLSATILLFIGMAMFTFQGRHIVQYLPLAVLLAALGYERYQHKRAVIFAAMGGIGGTLAVIYLLLKM